MKLSDTFKIFAVMMAMSIQILAQWGTAPGAVAETGEKSAVDYSKRTISALGIGAIPANAANVGMARANAIRAARLDALRNLVEAVRGVRVSSETTVENSMVTSDVIKTQVEGMVRGARQVGETKYLSDSSVEVVMEVPMSGIMDILMPTAADATAAAVPEPNIVVTEPPPAVVSDNPGAPITGIIIDARGLGLRPSMSPRVLTQDGQVIYGPGSYPRDFAIQQGVVGYHKDPEAAKSDPRVVGNPLTVRGVGTSGKLSADVVLTVSDAQLASQFPGFMDAIGACRVMFILD